MMTSDDRFGRLTAALSYKVNTTTQKGVRREAVPPARAGQVSRQTRMRRSWRASGHWSRCTGRQAWAVCPRYRLAQRAPDSPTSGLTAPDRGGTRTAVGDSPGGTRGHEEPLDPRVPPSEPCGTDESSEFALLRRFPRTLRGSGGPSSHGGTGRSTPRRRSRSERGRAWSHAGDADDDPDDRERDPRAPPSGAQGLPWALEDYLREAFF